MRRWLLILLAATCLTAPCLTADAQPAWKLVESGPVVTRAGRHDDVRFIDPQHGWIVNTRGEHWRTVDGGATWDRTFFDSGLALRSVVFVDENRGWFGTVHSPELPLFETTDGGVTWRTSVPRIEGPVPAGICGLSSPDQDHIFGVGAYFGDPHFIRSRDGGETWQSFDLSSQVGALIDVHFFSAGVGIIVGGSGSNLDGGAVILRTADGGDTWEQVYQSFLLPGIAGEWAWKISFPSEMVGYVSVETLTNQQQHPAKILKTTDGGRTWIPVIVRGSVSMAGLQGLGFITDEIGWTSGRSVTSVTYDGGASWTQLEHYSPATGAGELDGRINRFFSVNDTLAYAVGSRVYRLSHHEVVTDVVPAAPIPDAFVIEPAWPNPFRDRTTLPFRLDRSGPVRIEVIDLLGRKLRTLADDVLPAGPHEVSWNGRDAAGSALPSGSYIVLFDIGESMETKALVRIR